MKRLIALILVIGLMLCGCCVNLGSEPNVPEVVTTEPVQTLPPETTAPVEQVYDPMDRLQFTMTQEDVDRFDRLLEENKELALVSEDVDEVEAKGDELDEAFDFLVSQLAIANILHMCDLSDEEASQRYLDTMDVVTEAQDRYLDMVREIYLSDAPTKDKLFEDWTEEEIQLLLDRTDEYTEVQQEIAELEVKYQEQEESQWYDGTASLYVDTVVQYNRMAQLNGYDNYYTYAYDLVYERDYSPEDVEQMRQYAAQYLLPASQVAMSRLSESMQDLSFMQTAELSMLTSGNMEKSKSYVNKYLGTLPEEMQTDMKTVFAGNMIVPEAENAEKAAFTTLVGEDPFCYFGPGYTSALTLSHEMGHYYGALYHDLDSLPLDLAEIQSMCNEWLFIVRMEEELSEKVYQALVDYKLYLDITTVLVALIVDEFEQQVFTHEDPGSLTSDQLDQIMDEVCQRYGGAEYIAANIADMNDYWRQVSLQQPVYYVSYSVAAVGAISFYTAAVEDPDAAVTCYRTLTQDLDPEQGFMASLTAAGLSTPFQEDMYKKVLENVRY